MSQRSPKYSGSTRRSARSGRGRNNENGSSYGRNGTSNRRPYRGGDSYRARDNQGNTEFPSESSKENAGKKRSQSFPEQQGRVRGRSTSQGRNRNESSFRGKEEVRGTRAAFSRRTVGKGRTFDGSDSLKKVSETQFPPEVETFASSPRDDFLWGRHVTQTALEAGRPIHRIWCTSELRSAPKFLQLLREAKSSGVLVEEVTWSRLAQLTGGAVHQGIVLQTAATETLDLASLIKGCQGLGESPLLLALDGLTDPQNLGAIVRSAEALGAHGLIIPQRRSAGLTGSVAKVAAGALEHLPVARVVNLNRSLEVLKEVGYRVVGLAEDGGQTLSEVDLEGPLVVVTGSEEKGLSLLTRRHCDQLVRIPLRGVTPSLNASVATAMFLYEVARRGWMKDLQGQSPSPRIQRAKCVDPIADMKADGRELQE
ncbi:23S rRNA (guanosine(2251)-2'-O)-methyltransferase RlmB [Prochlorococcus sp. MIT 1341]|uniref:23S rRNA (guanosine(2251)-2'-O)-methyltransferase RlmB n=1 Tax=Prochlorococcus sp. MIT 1341 TaxID=3096221 RepID=UPI002A75DCB9|nr:23S rRNA (guanosine(2251)-2'-O)-methyltransferase RlmB [Prochlorococcus sp. MIT 1341]